MEEELRAILLASDEIFAALPGKFINLGEHTQGIGNPYIALRTIGDNEGLTLKGSDRLSSGRVQIDIYAQSYAQAKLISRSVKSVLHGYRGGGFRLVSHVATRDSREGGTNEAERLHRVSMDFTTQWRQS